MTDSPQPEGPDDEALIARAVKREPQAWAEIYERFSGQLLGYFLHQVRDRPTAEDLTAEAFVEALRAAHRFSGTIADLRAWIFRIGRNNLIDHVRRQRRTNVQGIDAVSELDLARAQSHDDPGDLAIARIERTMVLEAIYALSPDQREVVLLRLTGGLTSPQIAEIVGKTPGAVKALQHRAMAALGRSLNPQGVGQPDGGGDDGR